MGIANHEEYSLVRSSLSGIDAEDDYGNDNFREKDSRKSPYYNGNSVMNTIGRKKEKQIQQLRYKHFKDISLFFNLKGKIAHWRKNQLAWSL